MPRSQGVENDDLALRLPNSEGYVLASIFGPDVFPDHEVAPMRHSHFCFQVLPACALFAAAAYPTIARWRESGMVEARVQRLPEAKDVRGSSELGNEGASLPFPVDPSLLVRIEELGDLLASWQTIGGCGAGAGSSSSAGLKWVGRNVTGGLFNVQEQASYTNLGSSQYPEYNLFVNTFINTDLTEKWNVGVIIPMVYKYLGDPLHVGSPYSPAVDYSNGGLGDISFLATRRLGSINAMQLTANVGLPTGTWNAAYSPGLYLNQNAQLGFGEPTGALILDQTLDEVWGLVDLGAAAAWRGGQNKIDNYRAPTAAVYGYAAYFLGRFVPAFGLALSGFTGHDRDENAVQNTPLVSLAANASIELSTDWIALLLAASIPYKYDGVYKDDSGLPRSPWGFVPWTVAFGVSVAPF
jgi:hypothetical protein